MPDADKMRQYVRQGGVAPHVGGASARYVFENKQRVVRVAPHVGGASARQYFNMNRASSELSHPMWVARVPDIKQINRGVEAGRRTPCGWRECPIRPYESVGGQVCRTPCGWRECPTKIERPDATPMVLSHPMWVARVPDGFRVRRIRNARLVAPHVGGASARLQLGKRFNLDYRRTPCGWRECPTLLRYQKSLYILSHPMWVARVPDLSAYAMYTIYSVAPHVGGASARCLLTRLCLIAALVAPHVGGASAR